MANEIESLVEVYEDLPLTNFPVSEDTFPRMSDVSVTLLPLVLQYNNYYQSGQSALAQQLLDTNPDLNACMHNAEKWNMIRDAIIAMQRFMFEQLDNIAVELINKTIGIDDNASGEATKTNAYSIEKVDSMFSDIGNQINSIESGISNVDNTADKDKSVKYATTAGSAGKATTLNGLNVSIDELNYVDGVTSNIQTQLNGKQESITGAATTITDSNLTTNRALISDGNGKVGVSAITNTELSYLDGVVSNIQTQLDDKVSSSTSRTKNYVLAAPNGSNGAPIFRALVAADIPNLAASKINAGTMAGKVVANAGAVKTLSDKQVRNIFAGTSAATAGSAFSGLADGDIYVQYE